MATQEKFKNRVQNIFDNVTGAVGIADIPIFTRRTDLTPSSDPRRVFSSAKASGTPTQRSSFQDAYAEEIARRQQPTPDPLDYDGGNEREGR